MGEITLDGSAATGGVVMGGSIGNDRNGPELDRKGADLGLEKVNV
jgi:hypothetical protein